MADQTTLLFLSASIPICGLQWLSYHKVLHLDLKFDNILVRLL